VFLHFLDVPSLLIWVSVYPMHLLNVFFSTYDLRSALFSNGLTIMGFGVLLVQLSKLSTVRITRVLVADSADLIK
jgi:hypothetical protein